MKKKWLFGIIFMLCFCCGCNRKSDKKESNALSYYGKHISVKDIKQKYDYSDDSIMPLYNVKSDEIFDFSFACDFSGLSLIENVVTVHTDEKCMEESAVVTYHKIKQTDKGSKVTVSPVAGVLNTETEEEKYLESDHGVWGNAPVYYLAIHYDLEAATPKKLDHPKVIPFTIKQEIKAPEAKGAVDSTGRFKLTWEAIEGATEYRIYKLDGGGQYTGQKNEPINGAKKGYNDCYLILDEVTDQTEFDNFAGENHGLAIHKDSMSKKEYVIGQNYCVNGEYYVSAVVDGKESGFCGAIPTAQLKLPYELTDECDIMFEYYKSVADLPMSLDVLNIDGSISKRNVLYTYEEHKTYLGTMVPGYKYQIEGTAITGRVSMDDLDGEYPETVGQSTTFGNIEPENNVEKKPSSNLPTIIQPEKGETEKISLFDWQQENTENHVAKGDEATVSNPGGEIRLFADSAEEEWITLNLVNGEREISLEAFPALQNAEDLEDVFYKVYYQNPYILGLSRFSYDYETMKLHIDYYYHQKEIKKKQKEMMVESKRILSEIINKEMTEQEKESAIYEYLAQQCEYDADALNDAKENGFYKTEDTLVEDSFNGYGILVNKKGVCQSYAYSYKLLCEMSGISCKVITGNIDGSLPHAWNAVRMEEEWFQTDATNNEKTTGIPYFLYDADSRTVQEVGFDSDQKFELDDNIDQYQTENTKYEYYTLHGLVAESIKQYEQILDQQLSEEKEVVSIRYTQGEIDQEQLVSSVRRLYNKHGIEGKLNSLQYGNKNGYILLWN